jgi:hypothetical protein
MVGLRSAPRMLLWSPVFEPSCTTFRTGSRNRFGRPRRAPMLEQDGDVPCSSPDACSFLVPLDRCPSLYHMSRPVEVYFHSSPALLKMQGSCITSASHSVN